MASFKKDSFNKKTASKTSSTTRKSSSADAKSGSAASKKRAADEAGLRELGNYLSAKDVAGRSSAGRGKIAASRKKDFLNSFYSARGGGQGKAPAKASSYPQAAKKRPDVRGNVARSKGRMPGTR